MCWGIVWLAWWWRDGRGSFGRNGRIEVMDEELVRTSGRDFQVYLALANIVSCESLGKAGAELPHSRSFTFRGNSVRGGRSGRGRWARARPFCRALYFRRGGEAPASGTSRLRHPK